MKIKSDKIKAVSLCLEVELSVYYIKKAVEEIDKISLSNDFYHLPILCLATGFERFMKCILIIDFYNSHNYFIPEKTKYFKGASGHDLNKLLNEMITIGKKSKSLMTKEATRNDINFMENNTEFRQFINILSEFATFGRYYNLNSLFKDSSDPIQCFMEFEYEIAKKNNIDIIGEDPYPGIKKVIIVYIERFTRGLSRFLTLGDFKELGKLVSIATYDFLLLMDSQLGECKYLQKD